MLESKELTRKFGSLTAVDHISLSLEQGHVCAMLGPNGSGKTTWMKMAAGLVRPTSGEVFYQGKPIGIESRRHIAYMSTEPYFYAWMTIEDAGKYYQTFFRDFSMDLYHQLLDKMELDRKQKISSLSSGMAAKMKIAVTMARDALVYMLDEPFNGIDLLARDRIRDVILEHTGKDKLLLISSHLVEELEAVADQAVFIRKGKLLEKREIADILEKDGMTMADRYRFLFGSEEVKTDA